MTQEQFNSLHTDSFVYCFQPFKIDCTLIPMATSCISIDVPKGLYYITYIDRNGFYIHLPQNLSDVNETPIPLKQALDYFSVIENLDSGPISFSHIDVGISNTPDSHCTTLATTDPVNHPSHYTSDPSGIECIQITRHRDFNIGSAIKYLWRAGLKHDAVLSDKQKQIEDLQKAIWYINDEIEMLQNQ